MPIGRASRVKPLRHPDFLGAHILFCTKQKTIKSTSSQSKRQNNEKVTVNFKHYHEYQPTCNILTKFKHLMASKLLYLPLDWEIFIRLLALEQTRDAIRVLLQTSTIVLLTKIVSNVNFNASTILAKD